MTNPKSSGEAPSQSIETRSDAEGRVILKILELAHPLATVWEAISDPSQLSQWFPDEAEYELEPGAEGHFRWTEHGEFEMRVIEVSAPHRLVWEWTSSHDPLAGHRTTTVEWQLEALGDRRTRLTVQESGFATPDDFKQNDQGWDEELGELVTWLA